MIPVSKTPPEAITITPLDTRDPRALRILKACLENWFADPKALNLTSPQMRYPFDFKTWIVTYYRKFPSLTMVVRSGNWIVGHGSLRLYPVERRAHLYHVFIDPQYRRRGLARKLVGTLEQAARKRVYRTLTLYVLSHNEQARQLYQSLGFQETGTSPHGNLVMEKDLEAGLSGTAAGFPDPGSGISERG